MRRLLLLILLMGSCLRLMSQLLTVTSLTAVRDIEKLSSPYRLATNNFLVTHNEIRQKIAEGYFVALNLNAIPQDNACITAANAQLWIRIDASKLPTDGRLPVWQELVPRSGIIGGSCTQEYQRMVNGVCESGKKEVISRVNFKKNGTDYCRTTYRWKWSDNATSGMLIEELPGMCTNPNEP